MVDKKRLIRHFTHNLFGDKHTGSPLDIERFNRDPENTYLVSFPRTGSHWLRMLIELYFERPLLTRTFFFPGRRDYLLLHTHDMELQVKRNNVIYLYRDPVDTVYSQLNYYKEGSQDKLCVLHWAQRYACHLAKWLVDETFTMHKSIVRYENLRNNIFDEFAKVTQHFGTDFDLNKLEACVAKLPKEEVKRVTTYNSQVMIIGRAYEDQRKQFRSEQAEFIWNSIKQVFRLSDRNEGILFDAFEETV